MQTAENDQANRSSIVVAVSELRDELGEDVFPEVVSSLCVEADLKLQALKEKASSGDLNGVRRIAHTIAGLMSQFGAAAASATASRVSLGNSLSSILADIDTLSKQCRFAIREIGKLGSVSTHLDRHAPTALPQAA